MKPESLARMTEHRTWDFDIFPPLIPFPDSDE